MSTVGFSFCGAVFPSSRASEALAVRDPGSRSTPHEVPLDGTACFHLDSTSRTSTLAVFFSYLLLWLSFCRLPRHNSQPVLELWETLWIMLKGIENDIVPLLLERTSSQESHLDGSSSHTTLRMEDGDIHTENSISKNKE